MRLPCRALALALGALLAAAPPSHAGDDASFARAAAAVEKHLGSRDPGPLASALIDLQDHDGPAAAKLLVAVALRPGVHPVAVEAAFGALSGFRDEAAADLLLAEAREGKGERRLRAIEGLGALRNPRVEGGLVLAMEDPSPVVRTAAMAALAGRRGPTTLGREALVRGAADPDPRVRSAALHGLAALPEAEAVPTVRQSFLVEEGRLFGDAWLAMRRLTGKEFPPDPRRWGPPGGSASASPEPPKPSCRIAGIPTWSRRIVFVLDTSLVAGDAMSLGAEDIVPPSAKAQGGPRLERWKKVRTRLDLARAAVADAVEELPADARFDCVFGGESAGPVFRSLEPADARNKDRAVGRLAGLGASGRQDFFGLLRMAWALPGTDPGDPEAIAHGADTVIYVGTALPSHGTETDTLRITAWLRRWNRTRQVSFLGIGVGAHGRDLLGECASLVPRGNTSSLP